MILDESTEKKKVSPIRIVKGGPCNFMCHGKAGYVPQFEKETNSTDEVLGNDDEVDFLQLEDCLDNVYHSDSFTDTIQCFN